MNHYQVLDDPEKWKVVGNMGDHRETMEELRIVYDNQFPDELRNKIYIVRMQEIPEELREIFKILPILDLKNERELRIHIEYYKIPTMQDRDSFSITSEKGLESVKKKFATKRVSTGLLVDLDAMHTPLGPMKLARLIQMATDAFLYTLGKNALETLFKAPETFLLNEFIVSNRKELQTTMNLHNDFFNTAAKSNFKIVCKRYAAQIKANAKNEGSNGNNVVFIVPEDVLIALASSEREITQSMTGDSSITTRKEGAVVNIDMGINLLPFSRNPNDGSNEYVDNLEFFRESYLVGVVSYYNIMNVVKKINDPSRFKKETFYHEIYNADTDEMERIPLSALIAHSCRFDQDGNLDVDEHNKLIALYKKNNPKKDLLDTFIRKVGVNDYKICERFGQLETFDTEYAERFSNMFMENYLKQPGFEEDLANINEMLTRIAQNVSGKIVDHIGNSNHADVTYLIDIDVNDELIADVINYSSPDLKGVGFWKFINGFPMFEAILKNSKTVELVDYINIYESSIRIFSALRKFFGKNGEMGKDNNKYADTVYLWALMQIVIFDIKEKKDIINISGKYGDVTYNITKKTSSSTVKKTNLFSGLVYGTSKDMGADVIYSKLSTAITSIDNLMKTQMEEIFEGIGDKYKDLKLDEMNPISKLITLFAMTAKINKGMCTKILDKAYSPLPFSVAVHRPHIRLSGYGGVFVIGDGTIGRSLVSFQSMLKTQRAEDMSEIYHYVGSQQPVIFFDNLKSRVSGVLVTSYKGGLGTNFVEKANYDPSTGKYGKGDMFVFLGSDFSSDPPHRSLTGSFSVEPKYSGFSKEKQDDSTNVNAYYNSYWGFGDYENYMMPAFVNTTEDNLLFNNMVSKENYSCNGLSSAKSHSILGEHKPGLVNVLSAKGTTQFGFMNTNVYLKN